MFVCDSRKVAYQNSTNCGDVNAGHDEPSRSTRLITAAITRVKRTVCRDPPLRWRPLQCRWQTLKYNKSTPIRLLFLSLSYSLFKKVVQLNVFKRYYFKYLIVVSHKQNNIITSVDTNKLFMTPRIISIFKF